MTEVIKDIGVPVHQQVSPTLYALAAYYLAGITFFGASFNSVVIFIVVTDNKVSKVYFLVNKNLNLKISITAIKECLKLSYETEILFKINFTNIFK